MISCIILSAVFCEDFTSLIAYVRRPLSYKANGKCMWKHLFSCLSFRNRAPPLGVTLCPVTIQWRHILIFFALYFILVPPPCPSSSSTMAHIYVLLTSLVGRPASNPLVQFFVRVNHPAVASPSWPTLILSRRLEWCVFLGAFLHHCVYPPPPPVSQSVYTRAM
jgi:hypothetical protein